MWVAFALHCKSYSHFFSKKFQNICVSLDVNFNKSLTNDIVSFEQLGPAQIMLDEILKLPSQAYIIVSVCGFLNKYPHRKQVPTRHLFVQK